jgi:phosphoadenosine phosphosulfate reductase
MNWQLNYRLHSEQSGYKQRVRQAYQIVERAAKNGRALVSTSWGKDSVALMHLCQEVLGPVELFHMKTAEMPGYEACWEYFKNRSAGYYEITTHGTLAERIELYRTIGLAHERSEERQKCHVKTIKKNPAIDYMLDHDYQVMFLGMRAQENPKTRGKLFNFRGVTYKDSHGLWHSNPLAWWTVRDVWAYIVKNNLPYNQRIYDAETHGFTRESIRNLSWISTDGAQYGRIAWLRQHFPKEFQKLRIEFPQICNFL